MTLKVAIPLKTNSERVLNKNLRPFSGQESLFDIKAQQLLKTFEPDDVWVSSENPAVENIVAKYSFHFHLRDVTLTLSTVKENQLVKGIVDAIGGRHDIMWCQVTQPLFNEFDRLMKTYECLDAKFDSIAVVRRMGHHILDERGNPINFNFGFWHKISQDLPHLFEVTWAAFIMRREMLEQAWYQIGRVPFLYETQAPLVDINTESDFETASILYEHYMRKEEIKLTRPDNVFSPSQ